MRSPPPPQQQQQREGQQQPQAHNHPGEQLLPPPPKFYRLRAHANPLAESGALAPPRNPAAVDWGPLFPAIATAAGCGGVDHAATMPPSPCVRWVDVGCGFGGLVASLAVHLAPASVLVLGMEIRDKVAAAAHGRIVEQRRLLRQRRRVVGDHHDTKGNADDDTDEGERQARALDRAAVLRANCMRCL
eukprot:COSAG01_NODE_21484_length_900_cov_1.102372_1_plen_187_part_01